jgi:hypothetical protein
LAIASVFSRRVGVEPAVRAGPEVVVSLTSIRSRLPQVHLAVESILCQRRRPNRLILWLARELEAEPVPRSLQRQQRRGLEIRFRPDLGPATKLLYALRECPMAAVLTVDDDTLYPSSWLSDLMESWHEVPAAIHCHRAHWICTLETGVMKPYADWLHLACGLQGPAHRLFPTGVGGALYPPGCLHSEVFNEKQLLRLCPTADDVWFKAMAMLRGVPSRKVRRASATFPTIRSARRTGLSRRNSLDGNYDRQIWAVFEHYDLAHILERQEAV